MPSVVNGRAKAPAYSSPDRNRSVVGRCLSPPIPRAKPDVLSKQTIPRFTLHSVQRKLAFTCTLETDTRVKITDLNPNGGIGANSLYLEIGPYRLLVDAGLNPKIAGLNALPRFDEIRPHALDFIILTHCHLDHLGALPLVAREHPGAIILCSRPSAIIAPRMLYNSINVMKRQRAETGIREYPLFQRHDVDALEDRFHPLNFEQETAWGDPDDPISFTFFHAGHVAGAAGVQIQYRNQRYLITGDVLFTLQRTLDGAQLPTLHFDTLVMETTRGATERDPERDRESEIERLIEHIREVIDRGGSVLLPVFALGRMQEVLKILHEARQERRLPDVPVFATGLGMALVDYFDAITRKTGLVRFQQKVIKELKVRKLTGRFRPGKPPPEQGIYVLSSGMLVENTPSYAAAASFLDNHRHAIVFCGYCDPDTPGGALLRSQPGDRFTFEALDHTAEVKAEISQLDLSAHADREELLEFALAIQPRHLVLTHGDPEAKAWFKTALADLEISAQVHDLDPLRTCTLA